MPNPTAGPSSTTGPNSTATQATGLRWLWVALVAIVLDQATKLAVIEYMELYQRIEIAPFFNLVHVRNYGAAFSFLTDAGGWQRWFFTAIAIGVSGLLGYWLKKNKAGQTLQNLAFTLILGGAVGNVIDRIAYGYVVDFLDVYAGKYHWPAFNIADSAICIGAALLLWDAWKQPKESNSES